MKPYPWPFVLSLALVLLLGARAQFPPLPPLPCNVYNFNITMADGVVLTATLYTLNTTKLGDQKIAVQYQTFPYSKDFEVFFGYIWTQDPLLKLQRGHGLLLQHMRGSRPGTGKFQGFHGFDDIKSTLNWLKAQTWWNGVLFGSGYSAMGSLSYMSVMIGVNFTAQAVSIAAGDEYHFVYQNGAFRYQLVNGMLQFVHQPQYNRTYLEHEGPDDFWQATNVDGHYGNVKWPAVHSAAWYDVFQRDQLRIYDGYRTRADISVRDLQFLIVGPSGHCFEGGQVNWGNSTQQAIQLLSVFLEDLIFGLMQDAGTDEKFLLRLTLLRAIAKPIPRVFWYVMGPGLSGTKGNWITAANSLPSPTITPLFLFPGGHLSYAGPKEASTAQYIYDPHHPMPTRGGCNMGSPPGIGIPASVPCGPWDQLHAYHNGRKDVLLFNSDPLSGPLAITGNVQVVLYVSTNATDTDFTVKLVDVFPNGTRLLVVDGIQRLRWRALKEGPKLATPGQVYRIEVDLWGTSYIFSSSHRIGVDVSSSNFPRFDVNPNTGRPLIESGDGESIIALNQIHMAPDRASQILLPVVPMSAVAPFGTKAIQDLLHYIHRVKQGSAI